MSVFRIKKNSNYTVMSNYHFKEKGMSLKAKGLLSLMLSLPDDWDYSIAGLVTLSSDGESSVRTALQELEKFGYLKRERTRRNGKLDDIIYNIYETPQSDFLNVENLKQENLILENPCQLNTDNKLNTKEINHKCTNIGQKSKIDKKINIIIKKCIEYDIDESVIDLLEKFFRNLLEEKKMVTNDKVEAILIKLKKVDITTQKRAVQLSLDNGYMNIDPDWLRNKKDSYNQSIHINQDNQTREEHEKLVEMIKNNDPSMHKF